MVVAIDFEAEGLLDGLPDGQARAARLDLLRALERQQREPALLGRLA